MTRDKGSPRNIGKSLRPEYQTRSDYCGKFLALWPIAPNTGGTAPSSLSVTCRPTGGAMASEHFCHFLDRAAVDPFLALTWKQFDRKFGWGYSEWNSAADFLTQLALDPVPDDPAVVERILARRTLRWTLKHS